MAKDDVCFQCEKCRGPVKAMHWRGEYISIRKMQAASQRMFGRDLCFRHLLQMAKREHDEATSELCWGCMWNMYDFPDRCCEYRAEIRKAGMNEKGIVACTGYKDLRED